ncbi:MAG: anti-sigma factor [Armatimonadota bacterium]|nr:anti-sigma factor [Armatimonadota bacterium]
MNCHRLSSLFSAYIDGELTGVEMIEIRNHLEGCPACRDELDNVRAVKRLVGRLRTAQPSRDLSTRICASLDGVAPYSFLRTWAALWQGTFRKLSPTAMAVSLAALGMVVYTARGIDEQITARANAPIVAAGPSLTMPVAITFNQPDSRNLRVVFANRGANNQPNRWIIPASD